MLKASAMKLAQASQHGLTMVAGLASPGPPQAMMDDGVGGAFDRAAADRVTLGAEVLVAHAILIRAEVVRCFMHDLQPARWLEVELIQGLDHVDDLAGPE